MSFLLLTFAVREEARPVQKLIGSRRDLRIVVTGMGRRNAENKTRLALAERSPDFVLTCGFAGALNPELPVGAVVFSSDEDFSLTPELLKAGARPATIHCAVRVAVTAGEKRALRETTRADAVEMESGVIRAICRERGIPSATVRVISDAANEDLPLDFNRLMDAEDNLSYGKLAMALVSSPGKIRALIRLQKQTRTAAGNLAGVLARLIADRVRPG